MLNGAQCRAFAWTVTATLAGCRSYDETLYGELTQQVGDAGGDGGSVTDAGADGSCTFVAGSACTGPIARFTGSDAVTGTGDGFCDLPTTVFIVANGVVASHVTNVGSVSTIANLQVGWDARALRLFAHVEQPSVSPGDSGALYAQDAVEIFASVSSQLTGAFGSVGGDLGPIHVVASALAAFAYPANGAPYRQLSPDEFAGRLVSGGYDVELKLAWATLAAPDASALPGAGAAIGFDFGVDVLTSLPDGGRGRYQTFLAIKSPDGGTSCGSSISPFCDDRTWCTPALE
jgi:hypothetical protein